MFQLKGKGVKYLLAAFIIMLILGFKNKQAPKGSYNIDAIKRVTPIDHLPQKDAQCIFKDSKGFVWIGTLDGLHRFDGYSFKSYTVNSTGNSICGNMILAIAEDTLGNIWVSTFGEGISRLNPKTDQFLSFSYEDFKSSIDINNILIDDQNVMWAASWHGVTRVSFDSTMTRIIDVKLVFKERLSTRTICIDKNNDIWIGTFQKTYRLRNPYAKMNDIECDTFRYSAFSMVPYKSGIMVGKGLIFSITKNDYRSDSANYELSEVIQFDKNDPRYVYKILTTDEGIWAGTRKGVWHYTMDENNTWRVSEKFSKNSSSDAIGADVISSLVKDDYGHVWVGTRGGGVSMISENPKKIEHYTNTRTEGCLSDFLTRSIFIDSDNTLWIGTENGGVNRLLSDQNYSSGFKNIAVNTQKTANRVYAIEEIKTPGAENHKRLLFMGTSHPMNLATVNPQTLEVKPTNVSNNKIGFVFSLEAENDTTLWAGTYYNGLWKLILNKKGEIVRNYRFTPKSKKGSITSFIIRHIFCDSKGNLWVSTDKGINVASANELKKEYPTFIKYNTDNGLPFNYLLQFFESKAGTIWFGTMGGGLIRVDGDDLGMLTFKQITTQDGLPNNSIKSIQEDNEGNLWLASNMGISCFSPQSFEIKSFDVNDGLQDNEFSEICSAKRLDGQMIFGGRNGFNVFYPQNIKKDSIPPKMFFTDFFLDQMKISPGDTVNGRVLLKHNIEYKDEINLKYYENSFSISFVGLQYNSPRKNQYKYKLIGYDQDWIKSEPELRIAKYTNLDPGKYTFLVNASNSDGIWNNEPIELTINITPPFWETLMFRIFVIVIIVILVFMYVQYRLNNLKKQRQELKLQVEERTKQLQKTNDELKESNSTKDKFFSIIAHDLRSPMNSFIGLAETMNEDFENIEKQLLKKMIVNLYKTASSLFVLLENLLHWSKLQRGTYQFNPNTLNLKDDTLETLREADELAKQKNIQVINNIPSEINVLNDSFILNMILRNLLSNAIKFSHQGSKVWVEAKPKGRITVISVKDQGVGMSKQLVDDLFRIDKTTHRPGTENEPSSGLGLILCKEFVEKAGGEIWLNSRKDKGTTFFFTSP